MPMAATWGSWASATRRTASAVDGLASSSTPARCSDSHVRHCAVATGIETTFLTVSSRAPAAPTRHWAHGKLQLPHDPQVVGEDELVEGDVDGALDRVFERDEPDVGSPLVDRIEDVPKTPERQGPGGRQVGLAEQRLFGEGAGRPQVGDRRGGRDLHPASIR